MISFDDLNVSVNIDTSAIENSINLIKNDTSSLNDSVSSISDTLTWLLYESSQYTDSTMAVSDLVILRSNTSKLSSDKLESSDFTGFTNTMTDLLNKYQINMSDVKSDYNLECLYNLTGGSYTVENQSSKHYSFGGLGIDSFSFRQNSNCTFEGTINSFLYSHMSGGSNTFSNVKITNLSDVRMRRITFSNASVNFNNDYIYSCRISNHGNFSNNTFAGQISVTNTGLIYNNTFRDADNHNFTVNGSMRSNIFSSAAISIVAENLQFYYNSGSDGSTNRVSIRNKKPIAVAYNSFSRGLIDAENADFFNNTFTDLYTLKGTNCSMNNIGTITNLIINSGHDFDKNTVSSLRFADVSISHFRSNDVKMLDFLDAYVSTSFINNTFTGTAADITLTDFRDNSLNIDELNVEFRITNPSFTGNSILVDTFSVNRFLSEYFTDNILNVGNYLDFNYGSSEVYDASLNFLLSDYIPETKVLGKYNLVPYIRSLSESISTMTGGGSEVKYQIDASDIKTTYDMNNLYNLTGGGWVLSTQDEKFNFNHLNLLVVPSDASNNVVRGDIDSISSNSVNYFNMNINGDLLNNTINYNTIEGKCHLTDNIVSGGYINISTLSGLDLATGNTFKEMNINLNNGYASNNSFNDVGNITLRNNRFENNSIDTVYYVNEIGAALSSNNITSIKNIKCDNVNVYKNTISQIDNINIENGNFKSNSIGNIRGNINVGEMNNNSILSGNIDVKFDVFTGNSILGGNYTLNGDLNSFSGNTIDCNLLNLNSIEQSYLNGNTLTISSLDFNYGSSNVYDASLNYLLSDYIPESKVLGRYNLVPYVRSLMNGGGGNGYISVNAYDSNISYESPIWPKNIDFLKLNLMNTEMNILWQGGVYENGTISNLLVNNWNLNTASYGMYSLLSFNNVLIKSMTYDYQNMTQTRTGSLFSGSNYTIDNLYYTHIKLSTNYNETSDSMPLIRNGVINNLNLNFYSNGNKNAADIIFSDTVGKFNLSGVMPYNLIESCSISTFNYKDFTTTDASPLIGACVHRCTIDGLYFDPDRIYTNTRIFNQCSIKNANVVCTPLMWDMSSAQYRNLIANAISGLSNTTTDVVPISYVSSWPN